MAIQSGSRVGPYEVTSKLGEGGMGVVFRARDIALQRDVALKLLPARFTGDADRLARLRREAQILASLNHPNIAQIYGLEQADDSSCIVMELVQGETLAARIQKRPLPFDEALQIARQVAEALDAAHEKGVVHRDLKPANIKLTPDGKVKVLDFGLAKAFGDESSARDISQSPTMTGSVAGLIVGTAPYMAPEQARGRAVDKRADIWAFGCLLYEMLTGDRAFDGADVTEILGAIIHNEPAWERIPEAARPLVRRCLEKDPARRLRDIGDAMALIGVAAAAPPIKPQRSRFAWVVAGVLAIAAGVFSTLYFRQKPPAAEPVIFQVAAPQDVDFEANNLSVSPDGRHVAFLARARDNKLRIWVRNLDAIEARPLAGTEDSQAPFWSPDNRFLGFGVGNQLKKIDLAGGVVQTLCTSATLVGSGAWNKDDLIIFGGRGTGPLQRVSASGGNPVTVTTLGRPQAAFHTFPSFLPGGRHFLYFSGGPSVPNQGVYTGSLDSKPEDQDTTRLLEGTSNAIYVPGANLSEGHLLYTRNATLMAHPFNAARRQLEEGAIPIAEQIAGANVVLSVFSASANGVLAYRTGAGSLRTLNVTDRNGRDTALLAAPLSAVNPRLAPDGKRLAIVIDDNLWVYNLEGRPPIKLTSGIRSLSPLWTPDGTRIVFEPNADGSGKALDPAMRGLLSIAADGSGAAPQPASPSGHFHPYGWSPAGELLATQYPTDTPSANTDIVSFRPAANAEIKPVVQSPANEGQSGFSLSPDGHWLAYAANTTGSNEIWVRPYGSAGAPIRVSANGGVEPVWSRNGKELFYIEVARMMSVAIDTRSGFDFKPAVRLFDGAAPPLNQQPPSYDVTSDGRFVLLRAGTTTATPITVVVHWTSKIQH